VSCWFGLASPALNPPVHTHTHTLHVCFYPIPTSLHTHTPYVQVFKTLFEVGAWRSACGNASNNVKATVKVFKEVLDHLSEGLRFYMSLQEAVKAHQQQCSDYAYTRALQRDDLTQVMITLGGGVMLRSDCVSIVLLCICDCFGQRVVSSFVLSFEFRNRSAPVVRHSAPVVTGDVCLYVWGAGQGSPPSPRQPLSPLPRAHASRPQCAWTPHHLLTTPHSRPRHCHHPCRTTCRSWTGGAAQSRTARQQQQQQLRPAST